MSSPPDEVSDRDRLGALQKTSDLVSALFSLNGTTQGWIRVTSDVPIVGLEILSADDPDEEAWGLAGIEAHRTGVDVHWPHQVLSGRWWTLFAMANPDATNTATMYLTALTDSGVPLKTVTKTVPPHGRIADYLDNLFGL